MYDYNIEKLELFTDDGQRAFLKVRDKVKFLLKTAGAFRTDKAIENIAGDSFLMIACLDRLIELGEIRLVHSETKTQCQVYIER